MNKEESLRLLVKTGTYVTGEREVEKLIEKGRAKLVVLSNRKSARLVALCEKNNVPTMEIEKNAMELGVLSGKPFPISAIGVESEGESDILSIRR